jgi:acetolactate synthase I/II/III large subunit
LSFFHLEMRRHCDVDFGNPDFVKYAESFGAKGYESKAAVELLPPLRKALDEEGVSSIARPVDYSENLKLTDKLGALTNSL